MSVTAIEPADSTTLDVETKDNEPESSQRIISAIKLEPIVNLDTESEPDSAGSVGDSDSNSDSGSDSDSESDSDSDDDDEENDEDDEEADEDGQGQDLPDQFATSEAIKKVYPFTCDECGRGYQLYKNIVKHSVTCKPKEERQFVCSSCNLTFTSSWILRNHENLQHRTITPRPYKCDDCGRSYKLQGYLKRHSLVCKTIGQREFICAYCGMTFDRSAALYHHNYQHKNNKQHQCQECKKEFNRKASLERHMLLHTGVKPYPCEICSKRFTQKQNLLMHIKVHTGERAHKCNLCEKSFITNSKLRCHRKKHFKLTLKEETVPESPWAANAVSE